MFITRYSLFAFGASVVLVAQALAPAMPVRAQDAGGCDDLSAQVDSLGSELDQLKLDAAPWLVQAAQFGALAVSDLAVAAQQGAPGLTPDLAATFGATAAQVGAMIDAWRAGNQDAASASYWRDLANNLSTWEAAFAGLAAVQSVAPSLIGMSTALSQLEQLSSQAQADLGQQDALNAALQDCLANGQPGARPTPVPPADAANPGGSLCSVGGQDGFSNSDCFRLELDAAFAVWQACTEQYFAAERAAFVNGGDLPTNTCDPAYAAAQDALQRQWGVGGTP